jgi:peptide/nickel transport system permease protein
MPFDYVLLQTDALLFVLLATAVAYALHARRREHLKAPWREVARSRLGMAAAVVLGVFLGIAVLDSIHFHPRLEGDAPGASRRYGTNILSVLDLILEPLPAQTEKTYSAPFATHLYSKETVDLPGGRAVRIYPRLAYGGTHLEDPEADRGRDILLRAFVGASTGLAWWLVASAALLAWLARRARSPFLAHLARVALGESDVPWEVILLVAGAIFVLAGACAELAPWYHILGTDKVGIDVLYKTLKSVRTGLLIGTLTTLIMLPFAVALGIMAGYFRGWVDDLVQYVYSTLSSIPAVLLIAAAALLLDVYMSKHADDFTSLAARADLRLLALCVILGITSWTSLCRLLRGEALKLREIDFVQAAHAFGVSHARVILRHMLPNVMHIIMISIVLDFSSLVLAEAVLSYINIGVDPSMESWGNMINGARLELAREPVVWWSLAAALIFMFALVLAANLFSDAVRDAFDPRLRTAFS